MVKSFKLAKNELLNKAIVFATEKHSGQLRKGTNIPYILHPIEVVQILYSMRADTNLMIAGVLHDTVEDTDTSLDEIRKIFGDDVAELVASNSEDKTKTWIERKSHTIEFLKTAEKRVKMLILADKLSNLRSIAFDYKATGDELWKRFNAPKENQAWYYGGVQDSFYDMQNYSECECAYWEFVGLYKDVFVRYFLDEENQTIFQVSDDTDVYILKKGNPQWLDGGSYPGDSSCDFSEKYIQINRRDAENLEESWNKPFWDCHKKDMCDSSYTVFSTDERTMDILVLNGSVAVKCNNNAADHRKSEFVYKLDNQNTHRFFSQLRIKHGLDIELSEILVREFGYNTGSVLFEKFCKKYCVSYEF